MSTGLIHVDLTDTVGALLIGTLFSVFLFGVVTLQTHLYFTQFREDHWSTKALVGGIWLLEVGHTIAICYEIYHATIVLYGRPDKLTQFPALGATLTIGGLITLLVQGFFALRVWKVLPDPFRYVGLVCGLASFARMIGSTFLSYQGITTPSAAQYAVQWKWLITTLLVGGAIIDVTIAASMVYYLHKSRKNAFSKVARLLDRLVAYTIRTGLLTSVSAVALLICFLSIPETLIWLALYTFLAKLYSNSLLSALNERREMRETIYSASVELYGEPRTGTVVRRDPTGRENSRIDVRRKKASFRTVSNHGFFSSLKLYQSR
ncbi:uncharacterized protein LACBIDRAFT_300118 [Laccaria bicolor S238N-H82]|uniref:Predicted protein n=1 Tax=Laccaria bicolor (strain S238N-H82 / ATCC MYA-4686) TaxID=486041 RepID=B0DG25_LACBS|nr:uncharacterized protein LACBIDRAFT_300118 [Laccaria bicolor S238N-H82]EDR06567.1 predicted protein [Laccaria bicolor S238N-H82]|eukprot:XP_001882939.1 predicted protein [Laccaria bicolor S238N-H82]